MADDEVAMAATLLEAKWAVPADPGRRCPMLMGDTAVVVHPASGSLVRSTRLMVPASSESSRGRLDLGWSLSGLVKVAVPHGQPDGAADSTVSTGPRAMVRPMTERRVAEGLTAIDLSSGAGPDYDCSAVSGGDGGNSAEANVLLAHCY